ncbi:PARP-domain-containing protein [Trametes sanguinea]|nr:PARP-domain-containing protein [Trametes sanguinea]
MPTRKKAATEARTISNVSSATEVSQSTGIVRRTSTRIRKPSAKAAAVAAANAAVAAAKVATAAATKSKGSKRLLDESEREEEKPKSKRAKQDPAAHGSMHLKRQSSGKSKDVSGLGRKGDKVLKHGKVPVDAMSGFAETHQVLVTEEGTWDAVLNQTNIGKNANKYYILQVLHPVGDSSKCVLYTRWARVGENGQWHHKPEDDTWPPEMAIKQFKKQFRSKSGVPWDNRFGMVHRIGRYVWLERVYDDDDDSKPTSNKSSGTRKQLTAQSSKQDDDAEPVPDSALPPEVQNLCHLIFNTSLLNAHLSSMNYDVNKRPLGKLAKSTILSGFTALKRIAEVIAQPDGETARSHGGFQRAVNDLTNEYYSIIPHVFGRGRPIVIDSIERLRTELELVEALGDMTVASEVIESAIPKDSDGRPMNPLDARFRMLELSKMEPIPRSSPEFAALVAYSQNTDCATESHSATTGSSRDLAQQLSKFDVLHAFRVEREHETNAWLKAGFDKLSDGDRLLLWHGSRTTNFAGILKQGLRIAPPEAPVTGYMFGKGVYFADMMYKSAKFCHADVGDKTGLLLLCDVASKPFYEQYQENLRAAEECKEAGAFRSTKGMGRSQPMDWKCAGMCLRDHDLRGCHMPVGPADEVTDPKGVFKLHHNEYIVYDVSQIRLRYLLMVKMG